MSSQQPKHTFLICLLLKYNLQMDWLLYRLQFADSWSKIKWTLIFFMSWLTTVAKLWAFCIITLFLLLPIEGHRTSDFTFPPIPSTTPFPCDVAVKFHSNSLFYFRERVCNRCTMYLFLNPELGPSDQIISVFIMLSCGIRFSYKCSTSLDL